MSVLVGVRVSLWPVTAADGGEYVELARVSVALHRGLISVPTTAAKFGAYLRRFDGINAVGFVLRLNGTRELAGFVNINEIVRVPNARGSLGFGGFAPTVGHGYAAEGVRLAVGYGFGELGLDRLEAAVQPTNKASRRVVEQVGFRPTAQPPEAIYIDGEWRDHERWEITAEGGPDKNV